MSEEQLLITLGVQDKGSTTQIKSLNQQLKYLDREFKTASQSSKNFENTAEGLRTKINYLGNKIEATKAKLQAYKNQMQQAQQGVAKKREELERLNQAEGDNSAAISKCEKQLERYQQQVLNAGRNINLTEAELRNLEDTLQETNNKLNSQALENYKQKMSELGDKVKSTGDKIKSFGEGMDKAGTTLMKLASPIVGLSVAASKVGIDFEKAMSTVQATSQASASDMEKLTAKAKEMGANTSKSASDAAEGLNYMALAGWKTEEMLAGIEPILKASVAYNADLGTTSDLATDSLSALGLTAQDLGKYMDIVSNAQSNANTTGTDLMQAYIEVGGTFKNLNTSLEESSTLLGVMANRGIKSSEAGNALNSILINLTKKSGESADAMEALGISAFDSEGNFRGITAVLKDVNEKLSGMTEEQETNYKSMIAGKNQITAFNALLAGLGEEYDTLYSKQSNCTGALEKMYKTMSNNTQGKIDEFKSKLEALGIELSDKLLPHINKLLDKFMNLVDWFGNLSDSTQESILKFGFYTLGAGAALKVTGKFASGIGSLVSVGGSLINFLGTNTSLLGSLGTKLTATTTATGALKIGIGALSKAYLPLAVATTAAGAAIYAVKEHSKAMNDTILKSSEEMGFLEEAFVKLSGGTVKTRKELEEMGLVQEELSDGLTKEFKSAINSATSDIQNFNFQLSQVKIDGVITSEECDSLQSRVNDLCNSAIETINSKTQEMQSSLGKAFEVDGILDNDEQKIIEYYTNAGEKNKAEVQRMQSEINELLRKVREEGYELTGEDEAKIKNYYAEIKRIELEFQASNNEEILFEKNKFLNRANNLDLESAQKLLSERRKYYEEERAEKLAQYDTLIADLQKNLENMDTETRASAERKIESLQAEKEQQSELMQQYYNEEYNALVEQNSNLAGELDKYNASILTSKDKACQEEFETLKSHYENINQVTESGLTTLYNKTTEAYENVYVEVDKVTGDVVGLTRFYSNEAQITAGKVTGANSTISNSMNGLSQSAQNSYNNIIRAVTDGKNTHVNSANQIVNADGRIVGSLNEVKTTFGGVKSGILDINGTPVTVHVNKDGTISNLDEIKRNINSIPTEKNVHVNVIYNGSGTYSDGRGNVWVGGNKVMGSGYATGTTNATRGFHLVGEQGPELVYFSGGETVLNALKTRNILTSGGYFDKGSYESKQLINNYNNSRKSTVINNYSNELDLNKLANAISAAVSAAVGGLSIKMNTKEVAKMIDKENGVTNAKNRRLRGC